MTLAELVEHPERAADVTLEAIPALLTQLTTISAALAARMVVKDVSKRSERRESDHLLTLDEAAAILKISVDFLRRSPTMRALRVRLNRELRISAQALQGHIRRAAGKE
jgi:hypothetical protein